MDDVGAFIQLSAEKYEVKVGGNKGNVSLLSFDGRYKIVRQVAENITFDERLQAAKALIDGSTPLAMMSREMKESEIKLAKEKGINPKQIIIAYDCLTPVVHSSNPIKNITMAQLKSIYTGKATDWKDVGGAAGPISVVSRDSSSGTFEYWNEHVLQKERVYARAQMQAPTAPWPRLWASRRPPSATLAWPTPTPPASRPSPWTAWPAALRTP